MSSTPLGRARLARGWSQGRLLHQLAQEAAAQAVALPGRASLKTQLSRWENGHRTPDATYQLLFAGVYRMTPEQLGFTSVSDGTMSQVGLSYADTWSEGVDVVTSLWENDVDRRAILRGSAYAAAAYAAPALTWLVAPDAEQAIRTVGVRRVGEVDVSTIRSMTASYRVLDNKHGGGSVRETAVRYLHSDVAPLLREGRYDAATGRALLQATAELTQLVGWMAYDAAAHGVSQRYQLQALRLAQAAGDRSLGAEILAAMSHQATYLGEGSTAVDLARAAGRTARDAGVPALIAEAAVLEAHGHAQRNDSRACATALGQAEAALDRADRTSDPAWMSYFDEAYLSAKFGHCFQTLGQSIEAGRFAARSLDMDGAYVRGRCFNLALLAAAHADNGDIEEACTVGAEAAELASRLDSARAIQYVVDVSSRLARHQGVANVEAFAQAVGQLVETAA